MAQLLGQVFTGRPPSPPVIARAGPASWMDGRGSRHRIDRIRCLEWHPSVKAAIAVVVQVKRSAAGSNGHTLTRLMDPSRCPPERNPSALPPIYTSTPAGTRTRPVEVPPNSHTDPSQMAHRTQYLSLLLPWWVDVSLGFGVDGRQGQEEFGGPRRRDSQATRFRGRQ